MLFYYVTVEVIQTTDPTAQAMFNNVNDVTVGQSPHNVHPHNQQHQQNTQNGGGAVIATSASPAPSTSSHHQQQQPAIGQTSHNNHSSSSSIRRNAFVKITEQPASKALRFRYECEGRSAGSIPGVLSTPENKTFPSIQVVGYKGRAVVVVSCVTKDPPYRYVEM